MIEAGEEDLAKIDYYEKVLKVLKKETKVLSFFMQDKKMSDAQTNFMFQGLYEDIDILAKDCMWGFRAAHTDFESLFLKLKLNDKNGENSKNLEEIIKMHERKPQ